MARFLISYHKWKSCVSNLNVQDKYKELSEGLSNIRKERESLQTITVEGDECEIELSLLQIGPMYWNRSC